MALSRRRFLGLGAGMVAAGGAGVGLVEAEVLPGRARLHRTLGLTGSDGVVPADAPGRTVTGSFESAARRTTVGWSISYPPGEPRPGLPVAVLLHGRGGDHRMGAGLGIDRFLAATVAAGAEPFVLAAVDGGSNNYWHRRTTGDDPRRMLFDEFVPLLGRRGLRVSRIGLLGWSMGGYGALLAAAELGPARVAAVVASSPALWLDPDDSAPGAFDGPDDFRAHDVFARTAKLARVPLRIDCGREDPFASATRELRERLSPEPAGGIQPGEHTAGYWRRMLPDQLTFLATHL
jgi:enterochelin esterase-like enzyme